MGFSMRGGRSGWIVPNLAIAGGKHVGWVTQVVGLVGVMRGMLVGRFGWKPPRVASGRTDHLGLAGCLGSFGVVWGVQDR